MNRDQFAEDNPTITVERERFDLLLYALFGLEKNPYLASSRRAYRDFCRTLHLGGESGRDFREFVDRLLEERIRRLLGARDLTQEKYDEWHRDTCGEVISFYRKAGVEFNIGQAQKWVNMTMKYLYVYGVPGVSAIYGLLHAPVDQYVLAVAESELRIPRPWAAWSKMDDYDVYLDYQRAIREKVAGAPLRWEFSGWNEEAARRSGGK